MSADAAPALAAPFDPAEVAHVQAAIARDLGARYQVLDYLGRGACATVWRAHDRALGQTVAVKRCPVAAGHARLFYRELRTMFRLAHPRIVRLINLLQTAPQARYLILEFCGGGSLRPVLQAARGLPPDYAFAAGLARQVAEALTEAHRWGVVHRDLKPENVLFAAPVSSADPVAVKLADFGLAHTLHQPLADAPLRALSGTPAYMAPEQFQGACVAASDLYALGAILYEMLHGQPLFAGTAEELARQHLHVSPAIDPALPRPWPALLAALLDKAPERRPTASELYALVPAGPPQRRRAVPKARCREAAVPASTFALHPLGAGFAALAAEGVAVCDLQGSVRQFLPLADVNASTSAGGGIWLTQERNLWHLHADGRLEVVRRLERPAELLCADGDRLALCLGNELVEHAAAAADLTLLWRRPLSECGLRPFLARRRDGLLVLAEGPRQPRLTLLERGGRTVQRVALPGLCWGLQAGPADTVLAALLVDNTLTWYCVEPQTCQLTPLVDSHEVVGFVPLRQEGMQGVSADGAVRVWDRSGTLLDHWRLEIGGARCRAAAQVGDTLAVLLSTADGRRLRFLHPGPAGTD